MKKTLMFLILLAGFSVAVNAQSTTTEKKKPKANTEQAQLKDHVCTDACHTSGKCVYAHGEKGHTCTAACAETQASDKQMEMKDHVCTSACTEGNHVYAHGERGHVCTDACKKM